MPVGEEDLDPPGARTARLPGQRRAAVPVLTEAGRLPDPLDPTRPADPDDPVLATVAGALLELSESVTRLHALAGHEGDPARATELAVLAESVDDATRCIRRAVFGAPPVPPVRRVPAGGAEPWGAGDGG